ncbi:deiodinase [Seminavis robusta]|uniref:Deiodinase n=1 Tax=Seminavis robusta TaxID=568900 RepID=A0A9N8F118_9STRA|nr:deiodinase [Seminavis robusta]|eukprot:Sro3102_g343800.1 deiodinase (182) ;mRNA; r:4688-5343
MSPSVLLGFLVRYSPEWLVRQVSDDSQQISLSSQKGKPVGLIFGSYTCPLFHAHGHDIEKVHQKYKEQVNFLFVYPSEAHPTEGWAIKANEGKDICFARPKTMDEKRHLAQLTKDGFNLGMPILMDGLDDRVDDLYGGMPVRLYVIDKDGIVQFQGPVGPIGFSVEAWEKTIQRLVTASDQ